jgi:hypothetical protein
MIGFLKENAIFIISSIVLLGLFIGVSELKKIPTTNQVNLVRTASASTTDNVADIQEPAATQSPTTTQSTDSKSATNANVTIVPSDPSTVVPASTVKIQPQIPQSLRNYDDSSGSENEIGDE